MAYQHGLSQQQAARIFSKIKAQADSAVEATLKKSIDEIIKNVDKYWLGKNALAFKGVTGNAYNSVTLGLYRKNKLVYANWNGKHVEKPTMRSLAKGQRYPLPEYYDGDKSRGYTGQYGHGGQWGPQLGPWAMYSQRYDKGLKDNDWTIVAAIPVEYAGYNPKIVRALQNIMDDMPNAVDYNKVRVENAPQQRNVFKDSDAPF